MKRRMRGLLLLRGTHSCGNTHHEVTAHNVKYLVVISLPVHLTVDSSVLERVFHFGSCYLSREAAN